MTCVQGSQRYRMNTSSGAVNLQVAGTSLHILFYGDISSSDNSDFLSFREDSEPWIS